jgi:hypothetical protein
MSRVERNRAFCFLAFLPTQPPLCNFALWAAMPLMSTIYWPGGTARVALESQLGDLLLVSGVSAVGLAASRNDQEQSSRNVSVEGT